MVEFLDGVTDEDADRLETASLRVLAGRSGKGAELARVDAADLAEL